MSKKTLFSIILHITFIASISFYFLKVYAGIDGSLTYIPFLAAAALSVVGGIYATKIYGLKTHNGISMLFITLGLISWFAAEVVWMVYDVFLGVDFPFPASPDIFYILGYPLVMLGVVWQIKYSEIKLIKEKSGLLFLFSGLMFFGILYAMARLTFDSDQGLLALVFNIFYNVGDAILISLAFYIALLAANYKGGKLYRPWLLFILALIAMFIADFLFAIHTDLYEAGDNIVYVITELLYIASYLFFAHSLFNIGLITSNTGKSFLEKLEKIK